MHPPVVGLVSPGEMGSALGAALRRGGARVLTSTDGRSNRTARLAARADLELVDGLDELVGRSTVVLSVVPPASAGSVARDLLARAVRLGLRPLVVDLNAIGPVEVGAMAAAASAVGLPFVDAAISGAPPVPAGPPCRLLLAGPEADVVAALPWTDVEVSVVGDRPGAASAAKMCTGGVRKGLSALMINALLTAAEFGVLEPVEAELRRTLRRDPLVDVELAAGKAWRFVAEMEAVAATQRTAGLDPAPYRAIAEIFRRTESSPLARRRPEDVDRTGGGPAQVTARRAELVAALRPAETDRATETGRVTGTRRVAGTAARVPAPMSIPEEIDRVVSRRVDNPTSADPGDDDVHAAADPSAQDDPDTDRGGEGPESARAARDLDGDEESEPTRSE